MKYAYYDHDTDRVNEVPPVQNTWYEVFDAEDVRLIWCIIFQTNDEAANKDVETRWTIDGNIYFYSDNLPNNTLHWVYRSRDPSTAGTAGIIISATAVNAGYYVDKRGQVFKVEVRMTSVPGTNQVLLCDCVRETLEET